MLAAICDWRGQAVGNHRTHCARGHPLEGDNVNVYHYQGPNGRAYTHRSCIQCCRERWREAVASIRAPTPHLPSSNQMR
jgi:hypothetical protein